MIFFTALEEQVCAINSVILGSKCLLYYLSLLVYKWDLETIPFFFASNSGKNSFNFYWLYSLKYTSNDDIRTVQVGSVPTNIRSMQYANSLQMKRMIIKLFPNRFAFFIIILQYYEVFTSGMRFDSFLLINNILIQISHRYIKTNCSRRSCSSMHWSQVLPIKHLMSYFLFLPPFWDEYKVP